jgi:predicted SAM-dependent methyltransferase
LEELSRYVQFGCGMVAPAGWTNFDASPTLRLQRTPIISLLGGALGPKFPKNVQYGDVVRGLPVADGSCRGIYSSHVLEHLALEDCRTAIANVKRHLAPGCVFRLVLPDLETLVRHYSNSVREQPAVQLVRVMQLGRETRSRGIRGFVKDWIGNRHHLWMWDYKSLAHELNAAGFVDVRRAVFGDSADAKFAEVESEDRWIDGLGIECRRPST